MRSKHLMIKTIAAVCLLLMIAPNLQAQKKEEKRQKG